MRVGADYPCCEHCREVEDGLPEYAQGHRTPCHRPNCPGGVKS